MKLTLGICAILSLLTFPAGVSLAQNTTDHSGHAMKAQQSDAGSMEKMGNQSIMLGEQTVDGVKAMGHLYDTGAMMAQLGKKENYHLMIMFNNAKTGEAIEQGMVAVKITDPKTGQTGEAISLMAMGGQFGADITLTGKGEYQLQVGSKLGDGMKRQFSFRYTVK